MELSENKLEAIREAIHKSNPVLTKSGRGGARPNSGPKPIGVTCKVSITLPGDGWLFIDKLIDDGMFTSRSEFFRHICELYGKRSALMAASNPDAV